MNFCYYSGVVETDGYLKTVINDLHRKKYYRRSRFVKNHTDLNIELEKLELIKSIDFPQNQSSKYRFKKSDILIGVRHIVNNSNADQKFFRDIVKNNPILSVALLVDVTSSISYVFSLLDNCWTEHVELHIDCHGSIEYTGKWLEHSKSFNRLFFYNCPIQKSYGENAFYLKTSYLTEGEVNIKNDAYFISNAELYLESLFFNPAFLNKLFIDGFKYRVAGDNDWRESQLFPEWIASLKDNIPRAWLSAKHRIDVCAHCEFRNVCVDNRVPRIRKKNVWYHTIECNYNPYIAKWKGEDGYRTLAECGVISNENGFSIDHERIAKINEELWGED